MPGPFDDLVGNLNPGQVGWLSIDANGVPTGDPATPQPPNPGPQVYAASVMRNPNDPPPDNQHLLLSSSGSELVAPLQSNVEKRDPSWEPAEQPVINSLAPNTAVCGSTDFELTVIGTGFTPTSVIVFNGGEEPTDYFGSDTIRTGVKPSLVTVATVCPVLVRTNGIDSNSLDFEFTDPARSRRGR